MARREQASGTLQIRLRSDTKGAAALDAVVAARLGRTETADVLEAANALFNSGDTEGARQKLRAKVSVR